MELRSYTRDQMVVLRDIANWVDTNEAFDRAESTGDIRATWALYFKGFITAGEAAGFLGTNEDDAVARLHAFEDSL